MRPRRALVGAIAAVLLTASGAQAATFTVTGGGDHVANACDAECTLRDAITAANAAPTVDEIRFDAAVTTVNVNTLALPDITDPVTIGEPDRDVRIDWNGAVGPALTLAAGAGPGTTLRRLRFVAGTGPGALLRDEASNVTFDRVALVGAATTGLEVADGGLLPPDPQNVAFTGGSVTGSGTNGIDVRDASRNVAVSGATISGNAQNGLIVRTGARNVAARSTIFFGNGAKPIALEGAGNSGAGALSSLRVGPRQADGTLPVFGTAGTAGGLDLFFGNPFSPVPPVFRETVTVPAGQFSFVPAVEPTAGGTFAATLTNAAAGTSEFARLTVPADIVSPDLVGARAISTREVRIRLSEPIEPGAVDGNDFSLQMASKTRALTAATVSGDGTEVALTSSTGWLEGEAGYVTITSPGAFTDAVGNAVLNTNRARVAAGPGDFTAPLLTKMSVTPKKFCASAVKNCRGPHGTLLKFDINETGKFEIAAYKGKKQIGNRAFTLDKVGAQSIKFSGKLKAGRVSAGRVTLLFTMTDEVGNQSKPVRVPVRVLGKKKNFRKKRPKK